MRPCLRSLEIRLKKDTAHLYLLLRWSGIRIHLPRLRLERQMQEGIKNVLNFKKTTYLGGCDCNRFGCTCGSKLSDKPETVGDKNRAYNRESG